MAIQNLRYPARCHLACTLLFLMLPAAAPAATLAAENEHAAKRFALQRAHLQPEPKGAGRFRIHARFAPPASAGELREGQASTLIGRLAKAGVGCDINALFRNGFEGN